MRLIGVAAVGLMVGLSGALTGCGGAGNSSTGTTVQPPSANAGGAYSGVVGTAVTFSSVGSTDPQQQALTYAWNFGDATTGTGVSPTHTYTVPATYTVSLTVTDTSGLSSTATSRAVIVGPPVADAGGPYEGVAGEAISFSGVGVDPQAQALTYAWTFGDGTVGAGASVSHTYAVAGNYSATLTVTDASGLTGSASVKVGIPNGKVVSGTQPVAGAHVYLFAAGTTGYGTASVSLLNASATGASDAVGAYVTTGADGTFVVQGDYTCTAGTQVYVYVLGGNPGLAAGTDNTAAGMMAAVGNCPNAGNLGAIPYITVNEVSTVAAAYALAGFATDATHISSSGTTLAQTGIANAFANAGNLATLATGAALALTPSGVGQVPEPTINAIANILAACVETASGSSSACTTLFANAESGGSTGTLPIDTATAAINIAHHPAANVAALYALAVATPVLFPALGSQPNDFTLGIIYSGGGLNNPYGIAIDAAGNAWIANDNGNSQVPPTGVVKISSSGVFLSGPSGFLSGAGLSSVGIAIDETGNAWVVNQLGSGSTAFGPIIALSSSGIPLSATGFSGQPASSNAAIDAYGNVWVVSIGGVQVNSGTGYILAENNNLAGNYPVGGIAIDGSGNAWATAGAGNAIEEYTVSSESNFAATIAAKNPYTVASLNDPRQIAIDGSGNAWITNLPISGGPRSNVTKLSSSGVALSGDTGYTGGGLSSPFGIAIDGSGNAWVTGGTSSLGGQSLVEFSNSGSILSGPGGYAGGQMGSSDFLAIDGSGDVWSTNFANGTVTEVIGAAAPVVTPLAAGVKHSTLGTRP
ncbi:MAG TPA: PKD domain-containing protein [Acidobacteriaceae bacterium]